MRIGDAVGDFTLPDQHGTPWRLSDTLQHGPAVVFFYPAAMSRGCTAEVCHFRDLGAQFRAVGAHPVGVSADPVDRQQTFAERHGLSFPLLSDDRAEVAAQFGVRRWLPFLPAKRHTFVVDTDFRILEIVRSETDMQAHADRALAVLTARS